MGEFNYFYQMEREQKWWRRWARWVSDHYKKGKLMITLWRF